MTDWTKIAMRPISISRICDRYKLLVVLEKGGDGTVLFDNLQASNVDIELLSHVDSLRDLGNIQFA